MSKWVGGLLVVAACCWAQQIDLSSLDKLEAKAKSVNRVNLDGKQLKSATNMVPSEDKKDLNGVVSNLQGVQVRNYEFDGPGKYSDSDLDSVRKQVAAMPGCNKIIESKEDKEHSEIYMCNEAMAIISAEPTEVSVVFLRGAVNMGDLGKLHGIMGTPKVEDGSKDKNKKKDDHKPADHS
jgi:Domain of unknown function (DUF4252)